MPTSSRPELLRREINGAAPKLPPGFGKRQWQAPFSLVYRLAGLEMKRGSNEQPKKAQAYRITTSWINFCASSRERLSWGPV